VVSSVGKMRVINAGVMVGIMVGDASPTDFQIGEQ